MNRELGILERAARYTGQTWANGADQELDWRFTGDDEAADESSGSSFDGRAYRQLGDAASWGRGGVRIVNLGLSEAAVGAVHRGLVTFRPEGLQQSGILAVARNRKRTDTFEGGSQSRASAPIVVGAHQRAACSQLHSRVWKNFRFRVGVQARTDSAKQNRFTRSGDGEVEDQ